MKRADSEVHLDKASYRAHHRVYTNYVNLKLVILRNITKLHVYLGASNARHLPKIFNSPRVQQATRLFSNTSLQTVDENIKADGGAPMADTSDDIKFKNLLLAAGPEVIIQYRDRVSARGFFLRHS